MALFTCNCLHNKSVNFLTDCSECAKEKITTLESHNRDLLAANQVMREALQKLATKGKTSKLIDRWSDLQMADYAENVLKTIQTKSNTE